MWSTSGASGPYVPRRCMDNLRPQASHRHFALSKTTIGFTKETLVTFFRQAFRALHVALRLQSRLQKRARGLRGENSTLQNAHLTDPAASRLARSFALLRQTDEQYFAFAVPIIMQPQTMHWHG